MIKIFCNIVTNTKIRVKYSENIIKIRLRNTRNFCNIKISERTDQRINKENYRCSGSG